MQPLAGGDHAGDEGGGHGTHAGREDTELAGGGGDVTIGTINIDINATPVATGDNFNAFEGAPYTAVLGVDDLLLNDSDLDGDTLTVNTTPVVDVTNGTLTLNANGTFTYTPNANFNGSDSFTYEVSDGNGGTAQATVTLTVQARDIRILFATQSDVNSSKVPGVTDWDAGEVLGIGDPRTDPRIDFVGGIRGPQELVRLAAEHGVGLGAHPGYRDLQGFGRRTIGARPEELVNDILYQVGALREFGRRHGIALQHAHQPVLRRGVHHRPRYQRYCRSGRVHEIHRLARAGRLCLHMGRI